MVIELQYMIHRLVHALYEPKLYRLLVLVSYVGIFRTKSSNIEFNGLPQNPQTLQPINGTTK